MPRACVPVDAAYLDRVLGLLERSVEINGAWTMLLDQSEPHARLSLACRAEIPHPTHYKLLSHLQLVSLLDHQDAVFRLLNGSSAYLSAPPGTRTPNPRIKSPLLCQLS